MRGEITSARIPSVGGLSEEQRIHLIGELLCKGILRSPSLRASDGGAPAVFAADASEPGPRIVDYLRKHRTASPSEIKTVLNLSRSRTYRALQRLLSSRLIIANGGRTSAAAYRLLDFDELVAAVVPKPNAPKQEESPAETSAPVVATEPAPAKTTKIRPIKSRRLEKMASPQPLAPTVRLAPGDSGRMRVAL